MTSDVVGSFVSSLNYNLRNICLCIYKCIFTFTCNPYNSLTFYFLSFFIISFVHLLIFFVACLFICMDTCVYVCINACNNICRLHFHHFTSVLYNLFNIMLSVVNVVITSHCFTYPSIMHCNSSCVYMCLHVFLCVNSTLIHHLL